MSKLSEAYEATKQGQKAVEKLVSARTDAEREERQRESRERNGVQKGRDLYAKLHSKEGK